jgi:hypothetical protein
LSLVADLHKQNNRWLFHVVDVDEDINADFDSDQWTECVEWTIEQLAGQPRVKRMAYDMWEFERKREAEKFKTFWLLKWTHNNLS